MTTKFEQLIEYVINDEEAKAKELFHDIVVEKSREIYENLMNEEEVAEEEECDEEELDEGMGDDTSSGDSAEDLIDEIETEEQGMSEGEDDADAEFDDEAEEAGDELTHDIEDGGEEDLEDRVVDLEDKLDELMAEFESLMGDEGSEELEPGAGGDALEMDDTEEFEELPMNENVALAKVPAPKHGDNGANAKSPVAFNSGAAGMEGKPVKNTTTEANPDGTAAYKKPSAYTTKGEGNLPGAGSFQNAPGAGSPKLSPATKPTTAQASGTNSKSPLPRG